MIIALAPVLDVQYQFQNNHSLFSARNKASIRKINSKMASTVLSRRLIKAVRAGRSWLYILTIFNRIIFSLTAVKVD